MDIIQSHAIYDYGSIYSENDSQCLNFYSFLLSYLTLNKYYGKVTMYCNEIGYDTLLKYIPYDEFIFFDKNYYNEKMFWNKTKLDAIKKHNKPLIHVDSDVFIFNDLFSEFIDNDKYDVMEQNLCSKTLNDRISNPFMELNINIFRDYGILKNFKYDGRSASTGVLGIKNLNFFDKYMENINIIYELIIEGKFNTDGVAFYHSHVMEEVNFYLTYREDNYNCYDILPTKLVDKFGESIVGDKIGYTHMWFGNKFVEEFINLMKSKIKKDFPDKYFYVEKYEKDVISKKDSINYSKHFDYEWRKTKFKEHTYC